MNESEEHNVQSVTKKNQISAYTAPPGVKGKNELIGNRSYQTSRFESGYKYCDLDPMLIPERYWISRQLGRFRM